MAVKTITIDIEAYETLVRMRKSGESFSKVIKKSLAEERKNAKNLLENLDRCCLGMDTLDHISDIVGRREENLISSPALDGD